MCASACVDERESDKKRERERGGVCEREREKVRKEAPLKRTKECS